MKKVISLVLFLVAVFHLEAQVSVYSCGVYTPVITQTQIENAGAEFYRSCVLLNGNYLFAGNNTKTITGGKQIVIKPGFKAGAYTGSGNMHLKINPNPEFDIALMNYANFEGVLKYEKMELGIALPSAVLKKVENFVKEAVVPASNKLNPFLEWEIRVTATFVHPATGKTQVVDGFYTRELVRNFTTNTWTDLGTNYPFRIRFAPPLNGEWKCVVKISINNVLAHESSVFPFQVIESGNPGYARVHPNKKNLMRGDQIIFPVGTNLPFDGGAGSEGMQWTFNPNHVRDYPMSFWKRYIDSVDSYGKKGGKFIRVINSPASGEIEFEKLGNYYDRLKFAVEMDKLIEVCRTNGTMIDFSLMYHTPFMVSGDFKQWAWDYGNYWPPENNFPDTRPVYCYASAFNSTQPRDMITNDEAFKYIKQRYRYYISRYGYSTNIYLFEIANEPWHLDQHIENGYEPYKDDAGPAGDSARSAVTKLNTELSAYIKGHLDHQQHLIGAVGYLSDQYPDGNKIRNVHDHSWYAPNIDVVCINEYGSRPDKLIISKDNSLFGDHNNEFNNKEESYTFFFHKLFERYQKPVFMTESGGLIEYDGCSGYLHHVTDAMRLGFTGLAGFNLWNGWEFGGGKDGSKLWPAVIRSQYHMNGEDVMKTLSNENGRWLQGRQVEKKDLLREHQYYVSNNKESCVGYVYNRTYNVRTNGCPDYNPEELKNQFKEQRLGLYNDQTMHIHGLKNNTDYEIDWYSFKTGDYVFSECFNTSSQGRTPLKHPTLISEFPTQPFGGSPLLWYVVKQRNCQSAKSLEQNADETTEREKSEAGFITVSPNPFNTSIAIESDEEIGLINITDAHGKIVKEDNFITRSVEINTANFIPGIYFLWSQTKNATLKIIKL